MQKAILFDQLPAKKCRCNVCLRRCVIAPDNLGYCKTRKNIDGSLFSMIYGVVSSEMLDPIEKKPLYHFYPGSSVYSLGSFGCNFRCDFCQNWEISFQDGESLSKNTLETQLPPEEVIARAKSLKTAGIAWTYNEPAIWLEYTIDCAKLAKKAGLYTVYVTNGYAAPEALDEIGPYLDAYRVDIKSFDDKFYQELIRVPALKPILETTIRALNKWEMHIEIVTNIIPTKNDSVPNLQKIARWIKENLGPKTPWHVTRFFPHAKLSHLPMTPLPTLKDAYEIGKSEGLEFVYIGNVGPEFGQETYCPKCGTLAIQRDGYDTKIINVDETGHCKTCRENLKIKM